jgi:hypothetical protein
MNKGFLWSSARMVMQMPVPDDDEGPTVKHCSVSLPTGTDSEYFASR